MNDLGPRSFRLGVAVALLGLCFAATAPALDGAILNYDDGALLLGPEGALRKNPASFLDGLHYEAYLPVYGLSLRLDGALGAGPDDTFLLHFQNVLWHALASYLVFCLLAILLRHRGAAVLGAILFALHPLHAESVAWISSRKDVVSGALLFLAWLLALRGEEGHAGWTAGAVAVFLLACFAKASAVVLPAFLLLAALLLPRYAGRRREAALGTWPFFAVAAIPVLVHLLVGAQRGVVRDLRGPGASLLALVAGWGATIQRTLAPFGLSLDYPEAGALAVGDLWLPATLLAAAVFAFLLLRRRAPVAAFGIAAFFAGLLPFNNVFPRTDVLVADRYAYLPLFGFAAVAAWAAARWRAAPFLLGAAAVALGVLFGLGAARFRDDETLWTATLEARPESGAAFINRGVARLKRATATEPHDTALLGSAAGDFRSGLARARLVEHRYKAARGLVIPLLELGEVDEALERAGQALDLLEEVDGPGARQERAGTLYDRGVVNKLVGLAVSDPAERLRRFTLAAADFQASADLVSRYPAWLEAGKMHLEVGHFEAGRHALEKAGELAPDDPEPPLQLAFVWRQMGDREAAQRALDDALRRARGGPHLAEVVQQRVAFWLDRPDHVRARQELGLMPAHSPERDRLAAQVDVAEALYLFRRGDREGAVAAADRARTAVARQSAPFLAPLGPIYLEAGRYDDAVAVARAGDVLGHDAARRDAVARAYVRKAYALLPTHPGDAARAMRAALDERPAVLEAGGAPLRGVLEDLRASDREEILLLGVAAAAGDRRAANRIAEGFLARDLPDRDRVLAFRLRALARAWCPDPDFAGARDDLAQVLARGPRDTWGRYRLAQVWTLEATRTADAAARREMLEGARRLLSEVIAENPSFPWARLQRGEVSFALGDRDGAKVDYETLRNQGFETKDVYLKEAVLHRLSFVRVGDPAELAAAEGLLLHAVSLDPDSYEVLFELGNVCHHTYDRTDIPGGERSRAFGQAVKWYRRAMAIDPRRPAARHEWARICLKVAEMSAAGGGIQRAWDMVQQVEAEASDIAELWKTKLRLVLRPDMDQVEGFGIDARLAAADDAMDRLETLVPGDPELPALRAYWHRSKGTVYYMACKFGPKAHAEGARRAAAEEFRRAYEAWPEDPENEVARAKLEEIAPEDLAWVDRRLAAAAFERGLAAEDRGEAQAAVEAFGRAVDLVPEWTEFRFRLARALLAAGRAEEARPHLERVANAPDGAQWPEVCYELGTLYLGRDTPMDRHIARTWLERFVKVMEEGGRGQDERLERARVLLRDLVPE